MATGFLSRGLEMAAEYVQDRTTFGAPLSERQAHPVDAGRHLDRHQGHRAISYECAARADRGEEVRAYAAMASWSERTGPPVDGQDHADLRGIGEAMDFPVPHWYHQIRHGRIGGGTARSSGY